MLGGMFNEVFQELNMPTTMPSLQTPLRILVFCTYMLALCNILVLHYWTCRIKLSEIGTGSYKNHRESIGSSDERTHGQFHSSFRFLTTQSGCRIARWFYPTGHNKKKYRDCLNQPKRKRLTLKRIGDVKEFDTIYCAFTQLEEFVDTVLDKITSDIVIISGQIQHVPAVSNETIDKLLHHKHVLYWFCQNIPIYGGRNKSHPKITPFPYGLKEVVHKPNPQLEAYERVFRRQYRKSTFIHAGYLAPSSPMRAHVPVLNESHLIAEDYFSVMAKASYILSPSGDRPECYRHYEALGLGTLPITELDSYHFRHLKGGPVIFGTSDWNLTTLRSGLDPKPLVNRNVILEQYWLGYFDTIANRSLNWWHATKEISN